MSQPAHSQQFDRIILGIDPGTTIMGYGLIGLTGKQMHLIHLDVLHLSRLSSHALKLKAIFEGTSDLIERYKPDEMAVEAPFYGKNVQSMLKLGRAQGVALAAALNRSIPVFEYAPRKIKQSITGSGNASKEQVAAMLKSLVGLKTIPKNLDATDGLAVAICHHFQGGSGQNDDSTSYSGWKAFVNQNPDRSRS